MKEFTFADAIKGIKEGFILNPNPKVVAGVIKGINRNEGECPCHNESRDKRCPCSNYREEGHCCCSLYILQS